MKTARELIEKYSLEGIENTFLEEYIEFLSKFNVKTCPEEHYRAFKIIISGSTEYDNKKTESINGTKIPLVNSILNWGINIFLNTKEISQPNKTKEGIIYKLVQRRIYHLGLITHIMWQSGIDGWHVLSQSEQ